MTREQDFTADEWRYLNATFRPTSRLTLEMWLQAAKEMGRYDEWLAANPAPEAGNGE